MRSRTQGGDGIATSFPTKAITVNGTELHYLEQGQGDPVIFVHGAVTDLRTWGLQMEPFAQHYHTIVYSLRYHYPNAWAGDSRDYTTTVHMQDLAALIQALGLTRTHVIGSFYGAEWVSGLLSWPLLRSHRKTCAGCMVSSTTVSKCSLNWPRSTSSRSAALKVASVRAASYLLR